MISQITTLTDIEEERDIAVAVGEFLIAVSDAGPLQVEAKVRTVEGTYVFAYDGQSGTLSRSVQSETLAEAEDGSQRGYIEVWNSRENIFRQ